MLQSRALLRRPSQGSDERRACPRLSAGLAHTCPHVW